MVVFTCNHCGESLKKNVIDKHTFRCKRDISVSCMDCFKDFSVDTYNAHNQCITELERYSGKDYVAKPNQNKGQKKQEAWVDMVRSISETKTNLSEGVTNILQTIATYDNIPRKKAKFLNFMRNSFRYMKVYDLEEAWCLLEAAMKESKPEPPPQKQQKNGKAASNGYSNIENEEEKAEKTTSSNKRKPSTTDDDEENGVKLKKKKIDAEVDGSENGSSETAEKFNWKEVIQNILSSKNNEIKLTKLKKKVLNRYKKFTGSEVGDKIETKFNKKLKKLNGIVVDNEKVRLIE